MYELYHLAHTYATKGLVYEKYSKSGSVQHKAKKEL